MRTVLICFTILACSLFGVAYWYFGGFGSEGGNHLAFIDAYATYREEVDMVNDKLFAAGGSHSSDRQALFVLLSSVLTETQSDEGRLGKVRQARMHTDAIGGVIVSAQEHVPRVRGSIIDVRKAAEQFSSRPRRARAGEIADLLTAHIELAERSMGELHDANEQVREMLTTIEEDGGALTSDHIAHINTQTTEAETRFDQLTRHFDELSKLTMKSDDAYRAFVEGAF